MAGILDQVGATSTPMQLLLLAWLLSGQLLVLAFAIPSIGETLTATVLIFVAMTFAGSGLVYLSLLPFEPETVGS
jgi:zinc transporter ZupT